MSAFIRVVDSGCRKNASALRKPAYFWRNNCKVLFNITQYNKIRGANNIDHVHLQEMSVNIDIPQVATMKMVLQTLLLLLIAFFHSMMADFLQVGGRCNRDMQLLCELP